MFKLPFLLSRFKQSPWLELLLFCSHTPQNIRSTPGGFEWKIFLFGGLLYLCARGAAISIIALFRLQGSNMSGKIVPFYRFFFWRKDENNKKDEGFKWQNISAWKYMISWTPEHIKIHLANGKTSRHYVISHSIFQEVPKISTTK